MKNKTLGCIGAGRVTRIILEGLQRQAALPEKVVVYDCSSEALDHLRCRIPAVEIAAASVTAAAQDLVILAVHPPVMAEVVSGIRERIKPEALVVSLAPKFTTTRLAELLGGFDRIARVIPNAPSLIGAGYNPIAFARGVAAQDRAALTDWFRPLGDCPEVDEAKLEAYAVLVAMGPTYLWYQLQVLREMGIQFGLSEAEITPALKRMVCGSARTLLESELSPAEVMNLVPVKPLAELEPLVTEAYQKQLSAIYRKIQP